jgi:hypothetical protein
MASIILHSQASDARGLGNSALEHNLFSCGLLLAKNEM